MAQTIHARKIEGKIRFKVWSTVSDSYVTEEMTEPELREWTLQVAVHNAIEEHLRGIDYRVERAIKNGTSLRIDDICKLNTPWDEERE